MPNVFISSHFKGEKQDRMMEYIEGGCCPWRNDMQYNVYRVEEEKKAKQEPKSIYAT